jgi:chorismate mutase-like protein
LSKPEDILNENREQIDSLDQKILELLNKRAKLSLSIAQIKSQNNMPVFVPERENSLLEKIVSHNIGPFDSEAIRNIFLNIMDESKRLQRSLLTNQKEKNLHDDQQ